MNSNTFTPSTKTDGEVVVTRTFNAPRELVFKAWTDPAYLTKWYAPAGCTLELYTLDVRPGGSFHHCIHNPTYGPCIVKGVYNEVSPPNKLVMTMGLADREGNPIEAESKADGWPRETVLSVVFQDVGGQTKVTLHQAVSETLARKTGAYGSWLQMLDILEGVLAE